MSALQITKDNFEVEVLNEKRIVLVDFWAEWCGPCKMLLPIVEGLAAELTDTKVCKVNVDQENELAQKFNIMTIPTLLVFKDGKVVQQSVGVIQKSGILDMLNAANQ